MVDRIKIDKCTGCKACFNSCKQNAITMEQNKEGFWYPHIDNSKCTQCRICIKKCPVLTPTKNEKLLKPEVYACYSNDDPIRINSTSGGMFTEFAKAVIAQGGYVVGARYRDDFSVEHHLINAEKEIELLRQSKYLQSDTNTIFKQVKELLQKGKTVLFSGTPCHNAALNSFLGKDYETLIQCDFICLGVISPKVFRKYLDMLEHQFDSKVCKVQFKNKMNGWHRFGTKIDFENGNSYYQDRYHDLYMVGYLEHNLYMRPSCHECQFKGLPRHADITMGDFWGIEKSHPEMDQNKGTSVIMLNTEKGRCLFEQIQNQIDSLRCNVDEVNAGNICLENSIPPGKNRSAFFQDLDSYAFDTLCKKYATVSHYVRIKRFVKKAVKKIKKLFIK